MTTAGRRWGRWSARVLAAVAVVVGVTGTAAGHGAAQVSTFTLRARADSVGVQFIARDAPAVSIGGGEVAFATPASAQSELDSLGGSRSFASAPYPGDLVVSLPATAAGLFGGVGFPVPSYPFYVSSSFPTAPAADEEVGPYRIAADSGQDATSAEARIGLSTTVPQVLSITSRTSVSRDQNTGAAVAEAVTEVAPFSIGNTLRIGDVNSVARVEYDAATGFATKSSSLTLGSLTVAGIEAAITEAGLVVAGTPLLPIDASSLNALLRQVGIELEYLRAYETEFSVVSAGLRVTYEEEFPGLGLTTIRYVLGQVSAAADPGSAIGGFETAPPVPPAAPPVLGDAAPAVGNVDTGGDVVAPSGPVVTPPAAPAGANTGAPAPEPTPAAEIGPLVDLWSFYPILAVGGAIGLLSSQAGAWQRFRRRMAVAGP